MYPAYALASQAITAKKVPQQIAAAPIYNPVAILRLTVNEFLALFLQSLTEKPLGLEILRKVAHSMTFVLTSCERRLYVG